jgi:DNA-binding cell septation regulator SpoVG
MFVLPHLCVIFDEKNTSKQMKSNRNKKGDVKIIPLNERFRETIGEMILEFFISLKKINKGT